MRCISYLFAVVLLTGPTIAGAAPKNRTVVLQKHTAMTVEIVPDLGTRFIFPFVLDEQDDYVPFTLNITNPSFVSKREPKRNSFVVTIPPTTAGRAPIQYGSLFVTVAGYEISVELRTTNDLNKHYSDVTFELGAGERENLIQQGIAKRTEALETEYKKKMEDLEKIADLKAIARVGTIALKRPSVKRVKEEARLALSNGDKITLFVDEAITYDPYTIFTVELDSNSNTHGISIVGTKLFGIDPDTKQTRPIESGNEIPQRIEPRESVKGVLTVLASTLNPKELLKLVVQTDKGEVAVQW
jgi:hypothetical protein